jgi:hypothetical protein
MTYTREIIKTQVLAESIDKPVNKHLASYLRKKLFDRSAGSTQARIVAEMSDAELVDSYHRYEEDKTAKITIVRESRARVCA